MKFKKIFSLIVALLLIVSCSGCSLNFFSVESLLSPPKQPGKNGQVQEAFNELMKGAAVQLKTPAAGEYQTSVILKDINGDNVEEAFVFYSDSALVESSVRLALLEHKGRQWVLSADIKGAGNGVYDVRFEDINNDGISEVFIVWSLIDAQTSRIVTVYELSSLNEEEKLLTLANEYCNAQEFADFNGDGKKDLIIVYLDDTGTVQKSFLRFFTLQGKNELFKYGEIALDSSISSVEKIHYDKLNSVENGNHTRLFIECLKNNAVGFTELVYWDNNYSVPVKSFKQPAVSTLRAKGVYCMDIDGDGLLEVPAYSTLYGDENSFRFNVDEEIYTLSLIKWHNVSGDKTSSENINTLHNSKDDYLFKFPWGKNVTVYYDTLRNALLFCKWNEKEGKRGQELFSVSYRENIARNEIIGDILSQEEKGAYYYKITDAGLKFGITDEFIVSSFIKMN